MLSEEMCGNFNTNGNNSVNNQTDIMQKTDTMQKTDIMQIKNHKKTQEKKYKISSFQKKRKIIRKPLYIKKKPILKVFSLKQVNICCFDPNSKIYSRKNLNFLSEKNNIFKQDKENKCPVNKKYDVQPILFEKCKTWKSGGISIKVLKGDNKGTAWK